MTRGALLIVLGIALTAAIGLSRVYLRVHFLSDVSGRLGARRRRLRRLRGGRAARHPGASLAPECETLMAAAKIGTEYLLFGGAALISLLAFAALILVPAVGSFGRTWEKATAVVVAVFVLAALLADRGRPRGDDRLLLGRHLQDVRLAQPAAASTARAPCAP